MVAGSIRAICPAVVQPQSLPVGHRRGIVDRPWTWTDQPDRVSASMASAAKATTVFSACWG
jgi:hypothetical protein